MSPRLPGLGWGQMGVLAQRSMNLSPQSIGTALCGHFGIIFAITIRSKKLLRLSPPTLLQNAAFVLVRT